MTNDLSPGPSRRSVIRAGAGLASSLVTASARADDTPRLDRLAGSLVMMGFRGSEPSAPGARILAEHLAAGRIGGVILFKDNCASPAATRRLTRAFKEAAGGAPVLIGIDQEGGEISRLDPSRGFRELPSENAIARLPIEDAQRLYEASAAELSDLGVTINFTPVVDLDRNPSNPIIGALGRSFGVDPDHVIALAKICIDAHRRHGVLTSLKHFPGHGSSRMDSHLALPDITASWSEEELKPFAALLSARYADTVMVGHLVKDGITEPKLPASLSRHAIQSVLRGDIGYQGAVVSDDMQMGALRRTFAPDESIRLGLEAGLDLFIFSNREHTDPEMPARFHRVVQKAVKDGTIAANRIAESAQRLSALGTPRRL